MAQGNSFVFGTPLILVWPAVIEPRSFKLRVGGMSKPRFDASFLTDPTHPDIPAFYAAMQAIAQATLGIITTDMEWPVEDGSKRADAARTAGKDAEHFRGKILISAHTYPENPPSLAAVINGQLRDISADERAAAKPYFYGGVKVLASVNLKAYPAARDGDKARVVAYLSTVSSLNTGERNSKLESGGLSAASVHSEAAKAHIGHVSMVNPAAGMPGIPGMPPSGIAHLV